MKWTFGTEASAPIVKDSRQLTKWGRILSTPVAISYLKRTTNPDFDRAWLKCGGQAESVAGSLYTAADRLEESVPLVSELKTEEDVKVAVKECTRFLSQILTHFPEIGQEYGFSSN